MFWCKLKKMFFDKILQQIFCLAFKHNKLAGSEPLLQEADPSIIEVQKRSSRWGIRWSKKSKKNTLKKHIKNTYFDQRLECSEWQSVQMIFCLITMSSYRVLVCVLSVDSIDYRTKYFANNTSQDAVWVS